MASWRENTDLRVWPSLLLPPTWKTIKIIMVMVIMMVMVMVMVMRLLTKKSEVGEAARAAYSKPLPAGISDIA